MDGVFYREFSMAVATAAGFPTACNLSAASLCLRADLRSLLLFDAAPSWFSRDVYLLGGRPATSCRFDVQQGMWEPVPTMARPRSGCAAAAAVGRIFVVGGWDEDGCLACDDEFFDVSRGRWQPMPPMP